MSKANANVEQTLALKTGNFSYNGEYLPIIFVFEHPVADLKFKPENASYTLIKSDDYNFTQALANHRAGKDAKEIIERIRKHKGYGLKRYLTFDCLFDRNYQYLEQFKTNRLHLGLS